MKIKSGLEADYAEYKRINADGGYSARVVSYGEDWAKLMEARIPAGATEPQIVRIIVDHAQADSHTADTDGITGFMYGAAVAGLAKFWEYGEPLRRWHNKEIQIGDEGDRANESGGVLNPALMNIRVRDDG